MAEVIAALELLAHPSLQEHYDNAGLLTGDAAWDCRGILVSLDVTEEVILEAVKKNCNLVVAHHPVIFGALKKINGKNHVEKTVIAAIRNEIAIYAIHTNLDNVSRGVNGKIATLLELQNISVLAARENTLKKVYTYVPSAHTEKLRQAIFDAGGGHIGNYSECSFSVEGTGTFKGGEGANPFVGERGKRHEEKEVRVEIIFPAYLESSIVQAMREAHPYEEVAYEVISLSNQHPGTGSGLIGDLPEPIEERTFLNRLKDIFKTPVIRHTELNNKKVKRVALCGGAGSFLISRVLAARADFYITADVRYHEFFDASKSMVVADIGHYESEQFTINLLQEYLEQKFPTFAVLKTAVNTNPVRYFLG